MNLSLPILSSIRPLNTRTTRRAFRGSARRRRACWTACPCARVGWASRPSEMTGPCRKCRVFFLMDRLHHRHKSIRHKTIRHTSVHHKPIRHELFVINPPVINLSVIYHRINPSILNSFVIYHAIYPSAHRCIFHKCVLA